MIFPLRRLHLCRADADAVGYYMSMIDVSQRLGIDTPQLREHVQRGSHRFTARDYLGFDTVPFAKCRRRMHDSVTTCV